MLYSGSRAPGKTDCLLVDFARGVGQGYGPYWRGMLFRQQYKQLDEIVAKSKKLFWRIFGKKAKWFASKSDYKWEFPDGEELLLRAAAEQDDYWNYHGHEYPWLGWDELTNWPTPDLYELMLTCNRSTVPGMPKRVRASCNPMGPGHNWVKERFVEPTSRSDLVALGEHAYRSPIFKPERGGSRCHIKGHVSENRIIMETQPEYLDSLLGIKRDELRKAWAEGDWDISVGGYFAGYWKPDVHVIPEFEPPVEWRFWRAMDWGFARPYSVGWYCIDPHGNVYRYRELYGDGGAPNTGSRESADQVADAIIAAEKHDVTRGVRFVNNPADSGIWDLNGNEHSLEEIFRQRGIFWQKAQKGPGSRKNGAQMLIKMMNVDSFYVTENCKHWLRTVPVLMPDEKDWEDVDTDMEDHAYDETRYSVTSRHSYVRQTQKYQGMELPGTMEFLMKYGAQGCKSVVDRRVIHIGD